MKKQKKEQKKNGLTLFDVNKIKFVVALRILVLSVMSNDVLPKNNVSVKAESVVSSNLKLILPVVLRRVRLSLTNWGQCRRKCSVDSISRPQLHNGLIVS